MIYRLVVYFIFDDFSGYCLKEEEEKWCIKDFIIWFVNWLIYKGWFNE